MILVMSGTSDGNAIAQQLIHKGYPTLVTVTSDLGKSIASAAQLPCLKEVLTQEKLATLFREKNVALLVDATHPYATEASKNAQEACLRSGVLYLRYQRPVSIRDDSRITTFGSLEDLIKAVSILEKPVLVTLGSKQLNAFKNLENKRLLYIRMLPIPRLIENVVEMGFLEDRIIAMQGPFSLAFNCALIKQWNIEILITKDSASSGGFEDKLKAVQETNIKMYLLDRPESNATQEYSNLETLIRAVSQMYKPTL